MAAMVRGWRGREGAEDGDVALAPDLVCSLSSGGMNHPFLCVTVSLLGLAAMLPAQEGDKAKAAEGKSQSQAPAKDDAVTAKDVAIKAIDKLVEKVEKKGDRWRLSLSQPGKVEFDPKHDYFWHMETEHGTLKIRYYPDTAPVHVASGIFLARAGYYDGLTFHRVIPQFMAQGGCPLGSGSGDPGYRFAGEFPSGGPKHDKPGILSMANAGPGTDGAQFFLTFVPTPHLDGRHTVWGEVVDGMATLKAIEGKGSQANNGMLQKQIKIVRTWVSVAEKEKAKEPEKKEPEKKDGPGK